jgi:predicted neuraminidase
MHADPKMRLTKPVRVLLLVGALVMFAGLYARIASAPAVAGFVLQSVPPEDAAARGAPRYEVRKVSSGATPFVHSVSAVELPDGKLRAFWFGGTREGATDAAIYTAVYSPGAASWADETVVATPASVQRDVQRWVRKLGNPVAVRDRGHRLILFFVSVTVGGWAGSSINVVTSEDNGVRWSRARRLITSPFLNLSTLVKGSALLYQDGRIGLPVYHEFIAKFGELLQLDADGEVLGKVRMSSGRTSLQPVIVPRTASDAVGFMRYSGKPPGRVLLVRSADSGQSWTPPVKTELPNPNAAVDALRLEDGSLLMAFNDDASERTNLSLARSRDDGQTWRIVHRFVRPAGAAAGEAAEFSYPRLLLARNGDLHLLYTVDKAEIRHARFNRAWLERP